MRPGWDDAALRSQLTPLAWEVRVHLDRVLEGAPPADALALARATHAALDEASDAEARGRLLAARGALLRALFALDPDLARETGRRLRGRFAVVGGVFANLTALEATLADIAWYDVDGILCLGDVLGPGPEPAACLERCLALDACLIGSREKEYLLGSAPAFWVELVEAQLDAGLRAALHDRCIERIDDGSWMFVEGSPRAPIWDDIRAEDVHSEPRKLRAVFDAVDDVCVHAGTHVPGVLDRWGEGWRFRHADELEDGYHWTPACGPALVNVGAVGQPRDGDPRACWLLVDGSEFTWRRVAYDVDATARKIRASSLLPDYLAARLYEGK